MFGIGKCRRQNTKSNVCSLAPKCYRMKCLRKKAEAKRHEIHKIQKKCVRVWTWFNIRCLVALDIRIQPQTITLVVNIKHFLHFLLVYYLLTQALFIYAHQCHMYVDLYAFYCFTFSCFLWLPFTSRIEAMAEKNPCNDKYPASKQFLSKCVCPPLI